MKGFIGVDWGTHSSKWCYQNSRNEVIIGGIWDSRVWRNNDQLELYVMDRRYEGARGEEALKGKLIHDPDQPFWHGERPRLGVSLGEAIVFSRSVASGRQEESRRERNPVTTAP